MSELLQDFRFGWRMLRKNPGFTLVAVVVLALGIGANTAMFSVVNSFLLRPLPVREVERLVVLQAMQGPDPFGVSVYDYQEWKESGESFESVAVGQGTAANLTGEAEPERVNAVAIIPDYFRTLGITPALGRNFTSEEAQGLEPARVVILSHGLWQRRYAGDASVLGKTIKINDRDHTVVGVMPSGFDLPFRTALWTPFSMDAFPENLRGAKRLFAVARLNPDVSERQAREELRAIAARLAERHPTTHQGWSADLLPLRRSLLDDVNGNVHTGLLLLLAAVGFLLLIACANLANLVLGRALGRSREIAIRQALGARRARLVRQFLTETMLLVSLGALAGLLLAVWVTPFLIGLSPATTTALGEYLLDVKLDTGVLAYTAVVSLFTGLLFGLAPAWRLTGPNSQEFLNERPAVGAFSPGSRRFMEVTVVVQVALTLTLLTTALMTLGGFFRLQQMELGFRPQKAATLEINLSEDRYGEHGQRLAFVEELLARVRRLPQVASAGISTNLPLTPNSWDAIYQCEGRPPASESEVLLTADRWVSPGYLETLGVTLLQGRLILAEDRADSLPVVVVSRALAQICWPGGDALGKRIRRLSRVIPNPWMTVVGLVEDVKEDRAAFRRDRPVWYVPYSQVPFNSPIYLLALSEGEPDRLAASLREQVWGIDPNQAVSGSQQLDTPLGELFSPERFSALVMAFFAGMGLLLAAVGLFGLLNFMAGQRTKEIGVRLALGARPIDILRLVAVQGMRLTLLGVALGLVGSAAARRVVAGYVFGASGMAVTIELTAALLLLGVALLASYLPARRAAKVDPMTALRYE